MNEHIDGDYLIREHDGGAVERILISPVVLDVLFVAASQL